MKINRDVAVILMKISLIVWLINALLLTRYVYDPKNSIFVLYIANIAIPAVFIILTFFGFLDDEENNSKP